MRAIIAIAVLAAVGAAGCGGSDQTTGPYVDGRAIYGDICSACHGGAGRGGVGPDLSGVLETFPECSEHMRWVSLGSQGWKDEVGPTYGATSTPVEGQMPAMAERLTPEQIAAVAVYERSRFGGLTEDEAIGQCIAPLEAGSNG
jgi:mono/diheme cytochrome c family protein